MQTDTIGEMAEWSIAAVLKTVEGHTSGGSNPSLSAIKPNFQAFIVSTPNFTPKSCKVGCFYVFLTLQTGQKIKGVNISGIPRLPITPTPPSFLPSPIYWFRFSRAYIKPEPNQQLWAIIVFCINLNSIFDCQHIPETSLVDYGN